MDSAASGGFDLQNLDKKMIVVILICSSALARLECTEQTARAVLSVKADQIGCASPATFVMLTGGVGVGEGEFARVKCGRRK